MTEFVAEVDQNEYLPEDGRVVDAIVAVTARGGDLRTAGAPPTAAQVIMVDTSGSMGFGARGARTTKIAEAKRATAVAIETLRDGVAFAVIAGTSEAAMVYPPSMQMATATPETRAAAKAAVAQLQADGGTAIGRWLLLANHLFAQQQAEVKHAILLTDGRNEHESPQELGRALALCEGRFLCDSRGVGSGWVADELRRVASTLLGTADGLEHPEELPAAFRSMTEAAMGKSVADVTLRVWSPAGARLRFVKQVFPQVEDLTGRRTEVSARIGDYPTGAWGAESRDYHISVEVEPDAVGEEVLAARVSLVSGGQVLTERLVLARWTDDTALSTRINPQVAHYTGQAELAAVIQEGLKAREAGDEETATAKLGRAVQLAAESGHEGTAKLLRRVVDVIDAPTGTVRLKQTGGRRRRRVDQRPFGADRARTEEAGLRSTSMATCPKGHASATADYCDVCGAPMAGAAPASVEPAPAAEAAPAAEQQACPICGTPRAGRFCEEDGYDFVLAPDVALRAAARGPAAPERAGSALGGAGSVPGAPDPAGSASGASGGAGSVPGASGGAGSASGASGGAGSVPGAPGPAAFEPGGPAGWQVVVSADRAYFAAIQAMAGEDAGALVFPRFVAERRFPLTGDQLLIGRRSRSRGVHPDIDLVGPPEDPGVSHVHALLVAQPDGWAVVDLESANGTYVNDHSADPITPNTPVPVKAGDRIFVGAWTSLTVQA